MILERTKQGFPVTIGWSKLYKYGNKNKRFRCLKCGHRTTKNQLKKLKGKCHQCKEIICKN